VIRAGGGGGGQTPPPPPRTPAPPTLLKVVSGALQATVNGRPGSSVTVQVFGADQPDAAAAFLGQQIVAVPQVGAAEFTAPLRVQSWRYISATATNPDGVTSVLSNSLEVRAATR